MSHCSNFPKQRALRFTLLFRNIWDIDIAHESDYLEFLHKIMEVIRCQKSRHAVM